MSDFANPWISPPNDPAPAGAVGLPKVALVKSNSAFDQHFPVFILESLFAMMLFLMGNVSTHPGDMRWTHRYGRIAVLPVKGPNSDRVMNPARGAGLRVSQHVCQAVCSLERRKNMYVIGHSSNLQWHSSQVSENSSKIGM